jgi:sugar lactone lactonase YvrE
MHARQVLRLDGAGTWSVHADLSGLPGADLNDMVVDACGRAYAGVLGFDPWQSGARFRTSILALVYPDGTAEVAADHLYTPNGSAITSDGRTLLVGETFGDRVSAFDIAPDGRLGPRRDWASWGDPPAEDYPLAELARGNVGADGCALDSDGGLWIADCFHQRVIRVIEGGSITDEITIEDRRTYAVEIGGPDGHTLYILVAPAMRPEQRLLARQSSVLATSVDSGRAGS